MTMAMDDELKHRYEQAGQGHVFDYINTLTDSERNTFLTQLNEIPVEKLASLWKAALQGENDSSTNDHIVVQPFAGPVGRSTDPELVKKSYEIGLRSIARGEVAALVLAGGQGTRLGFDGPKGMYNIELPSGRTLFQMIMERLKKLSQLASGGTIPFYIMTSPLNHTETKNYLANHNYYGLDEKNVTLFSQGMLPCLTEGGKIILESAGKVAMAPDGNGGIYPSLLASGALDDMSKRGIRYLHVFSIDNAMVRPADPVFIGYCIQQEADCGNKVVWKAHAHEKVGVVASKDGKPCIVEYSEITSEMAERTDSDGRLVFGAGNICNHFYTLDFIQTQILPNMGNMYHIARKKIKYYDDERKESITPTSNNGSKLETFIFDVFPLSKKMAVLDVERSEEFSPVKNAPGAPSDSPDTARTMISDLAKKWVVDAGGTIVGNVEASVCEISPLTSYAGEGLEELVKNKEIECPFSL